MKITLLVVGKTKDELYSSGINDYSKRINHYFPFEIKIIQDVKISGAQDIDSLKEKQADLILKMIDEKSFVALLDEKGKQFTSKEFSLWVDKKTTQVKHLIFVIGGAYGFSKEVYKRANQEISLSAMTFSHQMVRLIFLEQLYRAATIIKGEAYHHD